MHSFTFKTLNVFTLEFIVPNTHASGVRFQLFHLTQSNLMLQKFPKPKDKCHIFSRKIPYSLQLSLTIEKKIFMSCSSLQSNRSKFTGNYTRLSGASQCRLDGSILWIIKRKQTGDEACCFIFFFRRIFF